MVALALLSLLILPLGMPADIDVVAPVERVAMELIVVFLPFQKNEVVFWLYLYVVIESTGVVVLAC
jgi:hypothetical protein